MLLWEGALLGTVWLIAKHRILGLGKRVSCAKTVGPILIYVLYDMFLCEVPFGDRDKAALHLRSIIPQNLHFGGVNRDF